MIKSYIYGTPYGFNSYGERSLDNYFKAFYISSRKGARLMIDRQPNGTIFYNYLHYGLTEVERRPNSFFGMSLSINNGNYCTDFNKLFNWFDFLFQKLVKRGNILYLNEGNRIQYRVNKFDEAHNEIEWLKSNLPRIFDKEAFPEKAVELISFDSSFKEDNSGVIKCYNNETDQLKIINAFKQHRWLAISPIFPPEEEAFELHLPSVESYYNYYTEEILPIAINPQKSSLTKLRELTESCKENILVLEKYRKATLDKKEQEKSDVLLVKFNELFKNITSLIDKIAEPTIITPPPTPDGLKKKTKKCAKCQREESFSMFADGSDICKHCQSLHPEPPRAPTKKCPKCEKEKSIQEFISGNEYCTECRRSKSGIITPFGQIKGFISKNLKLLGVIVIISIFIVGIIFAISHGESPNPKPDIDNPDLTVETTEGDVANNDYVDATKFNDLITSKQYNDVVDYIKGKTDETSYKTKLSEIIISELWDIIETTKSSEIEPKVTDFIISYPDATNYIGIKIEEWISRINNYKSIDNYINKTSLTTKEKEQAILLINSLPKEMQTTRINIINDKPVTAPVTAQHSNDNTGLDTAVKINITEKTNTGDIVNTQIISLGDTYIGATGNFVTISVTNGTIGYDTEGKFSHSMTNGRKQITVGLNNSGNNKYKYNGDKNKTFIIKAIRK